MRSKTDTSEPQATRSTGLTISVATGFGAGPTKLSAFDAALREAGAANFNLIRLTSIAPPNSRVEAVHRIPPMVAGGWGDRLYVVLAESRVDTPHEEAWAGVGWVQEADTGRGLFVEHEGHSKAQVEADIESSLLALVEGRPSFHSGAVHMVVRGGVCSSEPICALAVAVFETDAWRGPETVIELP